MVMKANLYKDLCSSQSNTLIDQALDIFLGPYPVTPLQNIDSFETTPDTTEAGTTEFNYKSSKISRCKPCKP